MSTQPPSLQSLLDTWGREPGAPRLTWYGPDSERVELTGRVLLTWVAKAANLLAEEGEASTGTTVFLDLPAHWRTMVWALATWACGATVTLDPPADIAVTWRADAPVQADLMIHIALAALAMRADDVPPGAIDGAAEAMSQPDVLMKPAPAGPARLVQHGQEVDVLTPATAGTRVLVPVDPAADPTVPTEMVHHAVSTWLAGGSIVLVGDPDADIDRIAHQEAATIWAG